MPRFAYAVISVIAHVAAQETRITDPVAAAIGGKKLYELMKAEYIDERCEAAGWGPFPNATSISLTAEAYAQAHGTSDCKCGMLYGLAHSSVHRAEDVNAASLSSTAQGPTPCSGGTAAGFPCENVDLVAHLPLSVFTTNTGEAPAAANDLWGSSPLPGGTVASTAHVSALSSLPWRDRRRLLAHVAPPSQFCA
jgi:hypothetical protein